MFPNPLSPSTKKKESPNALTKDWRPLENEIMICSGDLSQTHRKYQRGHDQHAASNCIIACAFGMLKKMTTWNRATLNVILDLGFKLHINSRKLSDNRCLMFMDPPNVYQYFFLDNFQICVRVGVEMLRAKLAKNSSLLSNMEELFKQFLTTNASGIFMCRQKYFAFWKYDKYFFMFNPLDHDLMGKKWKGLPGFGFCYVMRFKDVKQLVETIYQSINIRRVNRFIFYPCAVQNVIKHDVTPPESIDVRLVPLEPPKEEKKIKTMKKPKPSPETKTPVTQEGDAKSPEGDAVKPPEGDAAKPPEGDAAKPHESNTAIPPEIPKLPSVTKFTTIVENKFWILQGTTHQRDPNFTKHIQGEQSLANAIAALAVLRTRKSKKWIPSMVDDILKLGEIIYFDSLKLPIDQLPRKVTVAGRNYTPEKDYSILGYLHSTDDKILDIHQALGDFFIDNDCGILTADSTKYLVAVWKDENRFYMFDPNPRDALGQQIIKKPWFACVTRFSDISDLIATFLSNIPKEHKNSRFTLTKFTITDFVEIAADWHNFHGIDRNKWILRGHFSQQDRRFPEDSRNSQCTANAAVALAFKNLKKEQDWSADTVDEVLVLGDNFYHECIETLQQNNQFKHPHLMVTELKPTFNVDKTKVELEIDDCEINGILNAKSNTSVLNLKKGMENFFADGDSAIVTANSISMAIWRSDEMFYYYDSHSRDDKGVKCKGYGAACLLRMSNIDDLTDALLTNFPATKENYFNISKIAVKLIDLTDEGVVKPPLNYYQAINELVAILRANFSEISPKFDLNVGKQTVPMCMAALAMNVLSPSFYWTADDVDQILVFGDKLYVESMEANYSADLPEELNVDEISTNNVKKEMKIGLNRFDFEMEEAATGNLEENLKEALENSFHKVEEEGQDAFHMILESQFVTASMWYDGDLIYLFDPRPRDEKGNVYGKDDWSAKRVIVEELVEPEKEENSEEKDKADENAGDDNLESPPNPDEEEKEIKQPITYETSTDDNIEKKENVEEEGNVEEKENVEEKVEEKENVEDTENVEEQEAAKTEDLEVPPIEKKGSAFWHEKEGTGKACVMRFVRLDDLINHLMENSPPNQRETLEFSLKSVKLNNTPILKEIYDPELEDKKDDFVGDWYEFKEMDYGKWILPGTLNCESELFPACNRWKQLLAMCIVALAAASLYDLRQYKPIFVDGILAYGDRFYTVFRRLKMQFLRKNRPKGMTDKEIEDIVDYGDATIDEYPRKLCMGEKMATWESSVGVIVGDITSTTPEEVPNIPSGLTKFFEEYSYGILQCKNRPVAVWKLDDVFYMFESRPMGPGGIQSPIGVACITRFKNVEDLAEIYLENLPTLYGNNIFEVHGFKFEKSECVRARAPEEQPEKEMKLGGYRRITLGKGILRGQLDLDFNKFAHCVHIQSAAIAFVALAMSICTMAETWTSMMVQEILNVGDELYQDSITKLGDKFDPWRDVLDFDKVNTDFNLGSLRINVAFRFTEQHGIIGIKDPNILNLRQGLERFFDENSHGILMIHRLVLAVWEEMTDDEINIYMFDPNSRGITGLPTEAGVACVMKFCNAKVASDHIMACMKGVDKNRTEFVIVPVEIVVASPEGKTSKHGHPINKPKPLFTSTPITCPDKKTKLQQNRTLRMMAEEERQKKEQERLELLGRNAIYVINDEEAIVRGMRAMVPDRENAVNIVAFVLMKLAQDLDKWTYIDIELILEAGYQLYMDSYNTYKPDTLDLRLSLIIRRFVLKEIGVKVKIRNPIICPHVSKDNVLQVLTEYFTYETFTMFHCGGHLISIYFKSGYFYVFDPYSRDRWGNKCENGSAVLIRFGNLSTLVDKILYNCIPTDETLYDEFVLVPLDLVGAYPL